MTTAKKPAVKKSVAKKPAVKKSGSAVKTPAAEKVVIHVNDVKNPKTRKRFLGWFRR